MRTFELEFPGARATAVRVGRPDDLSAALHSVGLPAPRPVVVVVGGASGLSPAELEGLQPVFTCGLVPAIEQAAAVAIDGGTDSGVMRALGDARKSLGAEFPLLGVAAEGTVQVEGGMSPRDDAPQLEPHHTHFLLVPGDEWGDESSWISLSATCLARRAPSLTVLVNGGDISYSDVTRSLEAGRPVLVVAGSGRAADEIAAAVHGEEADPRASTIAASELVTCIEADDTGLLLRTVSAALSWPSD